MVRELSPRKSSSKLHACIPVVIPAEPKPKVAGSNPVGGIKAFI